MEPPFVRSWMCTLIVIALGMLTIGTPVTTTHAGPVRGGLTQGLPPQVCGAPIAYGQRVTAQVPPGASCRYTFDGRAGDVIGVIMEQVAGALNPQLDLLDPNGNIIASNDNHNPNNNNSLIRDVRLGRNGRYIVVARSARNETGGAYNLTLWQINACGGRIAFDRQLHAEISAATPRCYYTFSVTDPMMVKVSIDRMSRNLQPTFQILGPDNGPITGMAERPLELQLQQPGQYTVFATGKPGTDGRFMVAVTEMGSGVRGISTAGTCGGSTVYGRMIEGIIQSPGVRCEYAFAAQAGDRVTILMTRRSNALDPAISLLGPDRKPVKYNDDDGQDPNSRIAGQPLPVGGRYTVVATSDNNASAGPFYLTVWRQ